MTLNDQRILELNELCDATIEGTATSSQRVRLEQLLGESNDAREYYVKTADQSASLSHYAGEMQMEAPDGRRSIGGFVRSNIVKFSALAAAVALVITLSATWATRHAAKAAKTRPVPAGPAEFVARVTGLKDVAWTKDSPAAAAGDLIRRGQRLNLASGFAEVTFDSGAIVLLQGPAVLDVKSAWESTLRHGTIRANVPPQALGFRVANSAVEVVDLGTAFSMVADADGGAGGCHSEM